MMAEEHYTLITPGSGGPDLGEVWQYRDLIGLLTRRSFLVTYKQTILGPAWLVLNPVLSAMACAFVFGGVAGIGTDGVPVLLFHLTGCAAWGFFSGCVTKNARSFVTNAGVFGKVWFPRLTVPIANVCSAALELAVQLGVAAVFVLYHFLQGQVAPKFHLWPLIPLAVVQLGILGLGVGILVSSLTTKYRDLSVLVGFGMQLWMYASPIVYPLSEASGWMRTLLLCNPVTAPVELLRLALLGAGAPTLWGLSLAVTGLVAAVGVAVYSRVERTFLDTI